MTEAKEPVDGTVAVDEHKTDLEENDVVFEVRTADGEKLYVATSPVAAEQLQNQICSVLDDRDST